MIITWVRQSARNLRIIYAWILISNEQIQGIPVKNLISFFCNTNIFITRLENAYTTMVGYVMT